MPGGCVGCVDGGALRRGVGRGIGCVDGGALRRRYRGHQLCGRCALRGRHREGHRLRELWEPRGGIEAWV